MTTKRRNRWLTLILSVCACFALLLGFFSIPKTTADEASNPAKVTVLSPESSENFSTLATTTGGSLTELDGETVYYSSTEWKGVSYNQPVSEYTATIEFKTSNSSDTRIYFNSATIGNATDYVLRFYQGYLMVYEPGSRSSWFTSSQYIFKANINYRDENWHTFTVSLYGGQFFLTMDGKFIPNSVNMNNPDKYSADTNHLYTNMIEGVETEINSGYVGIYGKNLYVRNFSVDLYDTDATVGKAQFSTSHKVYADIKTASTAGYTDEQFAKILTIGKNAIDEINLATTADGVSSAYATFTKRVANATFDDYEYEFSSSASPSTDFTLSGGTITTENGNQIVAGSSWTIATYNPVLSNYAQFNTTINLGVSNGDVRVYLYTNEAKDEGYLLRFYSGMTILYKSPFLGTADYWNYPQNGSGVIKRSDLNFQDGNDHTISFAYYENQFYLILDGEFFTAQIVYDSGFADNRYTKTDENGNGVNYDKFSFGFAGTNFTVKEISTTCYSLDESASKAQFENIFSIYAHLENMDRLLYGGNSWNEVLSVSDSYTKQILACYNEVDETKANALLQEGISAINAVEPVLEFDIDEDFEDGKNDVISVKAGGNSVKGTTNNKYLATTSTWNTFTTNTITKDYILSFDFRSGTSGALYFNFNTQTASPSRINCYIIRLYASGSSQSVQLYKGMDTENGASWIYTHASNTVYRDNNWHNLKVISADGKFTLYLDDTNIVPTSKSASYTMEKGVLVDDSFKMGYFGMQSQSPVDIDNFSVQPVESFESAIYSLENTEGNYFFHDLGAIPSTWTTTGATLTERENSITSLTLQDGSLMLTKDKPVFSAHLAVTFKATTFDETSRLSYLYTTQNGYGYRVDITSSQISLVLLNKDKTESVLGSANFSFDKLCTVRFLQYNGFTYLYADETQLIVVENTDFYQGSLSVKAENLTAEIYKVILNSAQTTEIAKAETLPITVSSAELGDKLLLGYQITGGGYNGLYNVNEGDALNYEYGMTFTPVMISMYMELGASARIHENAGLRWKTFITAEEYEMLETLGAKFGTRITSIGSEKYIDIPLVNGLTKGESTYYWNGALVNILPINHERIFLGTGYVEVPYADGETVVKYAKNNDNYRTYKGVVYCALNDLSDEKAGVYKYQVTTQTGETAYSRLPSTKYDSLKDIFNAIEDNLGATTVKVNEYDETPSLHDINVCYTNDGDETTEDYNGNALSVLIEYQDQVILVDAGTSTESSVARVINFLKSEGVQRIDHLILTHEHKDHAGGMPAVVEEFDVGTFYSRPQNNPSSYYLDTETAVFNKVNSDGTTVKFVYPNQEGWRVSLSEDTYFEIYNCTKIFEMQDTYTDGNYFSLEVLFVSGEATAFLGGDAVGLTQNEEMLDKLAPYGGVDVYQAQHHGTGSPYSPKALTAVLKPTYSLVPTAGAPADFTYESCEPYGRVYLTGYAGTAISFDIGANGKFTMRTSEALWTENTKVSVVETPLEYDGSNRTNGANIISGNGTYVVPAYGVATAIVYTVPENITEPTIFTLRGSDIYRKAEGLGNIRFRLICNDTVLYTGDCSTANANLNVSISFTAKAGDRIYFALDCTSEENSNTAVYMTSAVYIDGLYNDVTKCNYVATDGSTACGKNFYNGALYNEDGNRYTYAELFSYVAITVTEIA